MYIVGSQISDDQIPQVTDELKKFIQDNGGLLEKHEELGKKKLAYPVKKTRTGYYVVDNFSMPSDKIRDIEHKIRTSQAVIRYIIINLDEALDRMEKDRTVQARLKLLRPRIEVKEEVLSTKPEKKIEIDLDAEIEKALESEDLTK